MTLDVSTRLAYERTRAAYDRTLMAWIRTAVSMISFGFTIFKFFQLDLGEHRRTDHLIGPREFAIAMVLIGLASLVMGTMEHRESMRELKADYPDMPPSRTAIFAGLISALGILALISVVVRQ